MSNLQQREEWVNHDLKTWPEPFQAVWDGLKRFEVRTADRLFRVGDRVALSEWEPDTKSYTGRVCFVRVTYIAQPGTWGLPSGLCVLGIRFEKRKTVRPA